MWFGSFLIRAYVPRHDRATNKGESQRKAMGSDRTPSDIHDKEPGAIPPGKRIEGVKYAEAVTGLSRKGNEEERDNQKTIVQYQSLEEEGEWLKGAFTGNLLSEFSWDEHGDKLRNECMGSLNLTNLGSNLILIRSQTEQSTEEVLRGYEEWSKFWFSWRRLWKCTDFNVRREIWIKWTGIPLQAWSERFFDVASAQLGSMVGLHEVTSSRSRLDAAFVRVATGLFSIDRVMDCRINGVEFKIRVEEINCMDQEVNMKQGEEADYDSEVGRSMHSAGRGVGR